MTQNLLHSGCELVLETTEFNGIFYDHQTKVVHYNNEHDVFELKENVNPFLFFSILDHSPVHSYLL